VTSDNTASGVWADTACRSRTNERWLAGVDGVSRIHRKKPASRPMPATLRVPTTGARPCGLGSSTSLPSRLNEDRGLCGAAQAGRRRIGLFVRTIGLARAAAKVGLINIAYNMRRLVFHERHGIA
jgi:transposase, IS5 family